MLSILSQSPSKSKQKLIFKKTPHILFLGHEAVWRLASFPLLDRVHPQLCRDPRTFFSVIMFGLYFPPHSIAEAQRFQVFHPDSDTKKCYRKGTTHTRWTIYRTLLYSRHYVPGETADLLQLLRWKGLKGHVCF